MKTKRITSNRTKLFASLLALGAITAGFFDAKAQCMEGTEWPEDEIFTPVCSGVDETITSEGYAGEYSTIAVTSGVTYTFESSVATDFLTIANSTGTTAFISGTTPVVWTATLSGNIRMYNHLNSDCDNEIILRTRSMHCLSNDNCIDAAALVSGTTILGSNSDATVSSINSGSCAFAPGLGDANDVWYSVLAYADGEMEVNQSVDDYADLVLEVLSGTCGTLVEQQCDASSYLSGINQISFPTTAGTTYYIRTYGYGGANEGNFAIEVDVANAFVPENDECIGAVELNSGDVAIGSNRSATISTVPTGSCAEVPGNDDANDVWYSITVPHNGTIDVNQSVVGGSDLVLEVLSGSCGSLVVDECDASAYLSGVNNVSVPVTAGTTYYIRTYGYSEITEGDFSIEVVGAYVLENDDCIDAIDLPIGATCNNTLSSTLGATLSGSFPTPDCGSPTLDVWFKYTVPSGISFVDINFGAIEGSGDLVAQIYESTDNTCGGTISLVACSDDAGTSAMPGFEGLSAVAGKTYFMRVWSLEAGEYDDFSVCVVERVAPENDECEDAIFLTPGEIQYATNISAAASGMPAGSCSGIFGLDGANDVWFVVTADFDGILDVTQYVDDNTDIVLEVLSGSCGSPSEIVCQSNSWITGVNQVSFPAIAGTTYYIRTYGFGGNQQAEFSIEVGGDALPVTMNDLKGKVANNNAQLSWNTFSEQNNRGFEIQRSIDGKQFGKVGFVASLADNGNSSQNLSYNFTDATPLNGAAYYRLQQIDIDGKTALSNVVRLSATDNSSGLSIIAAPNPVANNLKVSIVGNRAENGVIQIADITGKVVKSIAVNAADIAVDMVDMAAGVYFVRYNDNLQSQVIKVVKQ